MIIECACKKYKFAVKAEEIGINGRVVQCGVCDQKWFQEPASTEEFKILKENFLKNEEIKEEINNSIKEILGAVDGILKIQSIQKPEEEIIDKKPVKITKIENKNNVLEIKKNLNEKKEKKYDLMIINNAKDVLILNRIIFK